MKKVFVLAAFAGMLLMTACGPSAEEIAAREKFVADSIAQVTADSLAAAEAEQLRIQDSIAADEAEQLRIQDSIDAAANANKGVKTTKKTTTTTTTTTEPAKTGDSRKDAKGGGDAPKTETQDARKKAKGGN